MGICPNLTSHFTLLTILVGAGFQKGLLHTHAFSVTEVIRLHPTQPGVI